MKTIVNAAIVITVVLVASQCFVYAGEVTIPHEFKAGEKAVAAEVNENFDAVAKEVNDNDDRITDNTSAIIENTDKITTNTSGISDHETRITQTESNVSDNAGAISSNSNNISDNAVDISELFDKLEKQSATIAYLECTVSANRFCDKGDGTIRDNQTGLIWLKDANCIDLDGVNHDGKANWSQAIYVAAANLADGKCDLTDGSSAGDWDLPTKTQWEELINSVTPIRDVFIGVKSDYYWVKITYVSTGNHGVMDIANFKFVGEIPGDEEHYVLPVRRLDYFP